MSRRSERPQSSCCRPPRLGRSLLQLICFLANGFWHVAREACFYFLSAVEAAARLCFAANTTLHFPSISTARAA